jgi:hypothetical protein
VKRLVFVCAAVVATTADAQTIQYGPLALQLPASARSLAMADIGLTSRDDDVIFYNPSQLAVARGTSASFERMSPSTRGATMSTVLRIGGGAFGVGLNYLEYRTPSLLFFPSSRADILLPSNPNIISSSALMTFGYGQSFGRYRVGVSANYAADAIPFDRLPSLVADAGVSRDFSRFTAALSLQHLGVAETTEGSSPLTGVRPPMKATLGLGWSGAAGPLDITATSALSGARNELHLSPAAGAEIAWSWLSGYSVAARAGGRYHEAAGDAPFTAGFGATADRVSLDVGFEFLRNSHVGCRAGFRIR